MIRFSKEFWIPLGAIISIFVLIVTFSFFIGTAHQIVLDHHGYHMTWWQASFIDVEELCRHQDLNLNIRPVK
jgi:hypothetical protein